MFIRRDGRGGARTLAWRVRLLTVGAGLSLVGLYTELQWVIWLAIVVLASGFLLRFVPRDEDSARGSSEER